jgi:hypothetical protein
MVSVMMVILFWLAERGAARIFCLLALEMSGR